MAAGMTATSFDVQLVPHPATPCPALHTLAVNVQREAERLTLRFRMQGDLVALMIPAPAPAGPRDGLWQHTCCEAFISDDAAPGYQELNFSPSGQWAAYAFSSCRTGQRSLAITPRIHCEHDEQTLLLTAVAPLDEAFRHRTLRLGLSAVIEAQAGGLSYWALSHPGERPDFHHRAGHVLALEASS